jgi:hypothetical protein
MASSLVAALLGAVGAVASCSVLNAPDDPVFDPSGGGTGAVGAGGAAGSGGAPTSCADGVLGSGETGVDCGGSLCPPCGDGLDCLAARDCESGFCADGVCCDAACDAACDACDAAGQLGHCTVEDDSSPGDPSCAPYLCDGASDSCPNSCAGPENCTSEAECVGGECVGAKELGDACVNGPECGSGFCVDEICCALESCGPADDCNICQPGTGTCGNAPADHPCADGLYCNGADSCSGSGICVPTNADPCAASSSDGDGDCAESCDEFTDSCTGSDPNGAACDDELFCNGADTCSGGTCSAHGSNPCTGHNAPPSCTDSCDEASHGCTANDQDGTTCATCPSGTCDPCTAGLCPDGIPAGCVESALPGIVICISNNVVLSYPTSSYCMACTEKGLTNACIDAASCTQGFTNSIVEQLYFYRTGLTCTAQTGQTGGCGWGEIMTPDYQPAGVCPTPQDCTDPNWANCVYGVDSSFNAYIYGVCYAP